MKYLLGLLLAFLGLSGHASEWKFQTHIGSIHTKDNDSLNNFNPGIGLIRREGDWGVAAGIYHNSYERTSVYANISWQPLHIGPVKVGAFFGPVTGYKESKVHGGLIVSLAGGWNISIIPPVKGAGVVHLSREW